MHNIFYSAALASVFFLAINGVAMANSAGLVSGMWFSTNSITDSAPTTVYSVVHNQTNEPLEGIATLVVNGNAVGIQEVRVGKAAIERIAIPYTFSAGTHTVRMNFTATGEVEATHTELSSRTILVSAAVKDEEPLTAYVAPKPIADLTENGKALIAKITNRTATSTDVEASEESGSTETEHATSTIIATVRNTVQTLEDVRARSAVVVRTYEDAQRGELDALVRREAALPAVEGFEPPLEEQSKKRELQIAAAGASLAGTMLEKSWLFYSGLALLLLGTLYSLWAWFRRRFANNRADEDDDDE